jgi:protein transport protein SEC24
VEDGNAMYADWQMKVYYSSFSVPSFYDWDTDQRVKLDRNQRPELTHGVVEYIAPQEYMVSSMLL